MQRAPNRAWVYFAQHGDEIKIGHSSNPRHRLRGIRPRVRALALLPGTREDERRLHARFRDYRLHGEWFRDCLAIRRFIAGLPNEVPAGSARIVSVYLHPGMVTRLAKLAERERRSLSNQSAVILEQHLEGRHKP